MRLKDVLTASLALAISVLGVSVQVAAAAETLGIDNEKSVLLKGRVVDIACTLTSNCPPNCGGGKRQMGLLTDDGKLYATIKALTDFAGSAVDLAALCGKTIEADTLLVDSPASRIAEVQAWREKPTDPWVKTVAFQTEWTKKHGNAPEWYRADPEVKKVIDANGPFGIKDLVAK